ncbi:hypothetical protein [Paenibacillus sp. FJAT-26967]|uniref:hypothetical protein n=1 Tax=Paenibacillus sp. FJAT-26967 TaxID=1729690 RepID=UPI0012E38ACC|nr:hypothetical protein [Paenibacillus sp. FJAT-26967]
MRGSIVDSYGRVRPGGYYRTEVTDCEDLPHRQIGGPAPSRSSEAGIKAASDELSVRKGSAGFFDE